MLQETFDLKYRPQKFEDVIGQDEAIKQLQGEVVRSYILQGPSGTGKTTSARIFAKEIDAEVLELDTASLGKADIENLKATAYYKPLVNKAKVIILDEVHNLSKQAWESLLKVIEEGPDFTSWVLITTEMHKVPKTIQTRSRIVEFGKVPLNTIKAHLENILEKEGEELSEEEIHEICAYADGGVREAVKMLETRLETGELTFTKTQGTMIELLKAVYRKDFEYINDFTEDITEKDVEMLVRVISDYITMLMLVSVSKVRPTPENDLAYEILRDKTSLNPELVDDLRDLQVDIYSTMKFVGTDIIPETVNSLYSLLNVLTSNYNTFQDVKYTTRSGLNWFSSQL